MVKIEFIISLKFEYRLLRNIFSLHLPTPGVGISTPGGVVATRGIPYFVPDSLEL